MGSSKDGIVTHCRRHLSLQHLRESLQSPMTNAAVDRELIARSVMICNCATLHGGVSLVQPDGDQGASGEVDVVHRALADEERREAEHDAEGRGDHEARAPTARRCR